MRHIGEDSGGTSTLRDVDYRALAAFRSGLRKFLRASGERARAAGVTTTQHQLLLAVKGHPGPDPPLMGDLAEALQVRPHTAVGLVDRAAKAGLAARIAMDGDRRRVGVVLTAKGDRVLARITEANRLELVGLRRLLGRVSWGRSARGAVRLALPLALLGASLAGCGSWGSDPYDESRMDLKPMPAKVTAVRDTGAFQEGRVLSTAPYIGPLDPSPVKTIRLDVIDRVIEIAPGVRFNAWTFGGQVPAPVIRARVGDRIRIRMTNRSDEVMPGVASFGMPMMHSIDFHAAMVSPQDKYRSIAPGQTIEFEFRPNYPGVFMYHCGTPMILEHIASGMYGVMVVEPRGGYPTKVDREYVVVQSEFYVMPDPEKRTVDGHPLYVLDVEKLRTKASTYTVFNGVYNGMVDHPLLTAPGERVRLFVLNVGPSNTSSFHVVGTIFDRVWFDGNPDNQFRGMQTVLLPSSGGAIVEFRVPEAGKYIMVDHHFANASQGAIGVLDASPGTSSLPAEPLEHHNFPATPTGPADPDAARAKVVFESKCVACHTIGQGVKLGPDLQGVTSRRSEAWLNRWLESPERMLASDDSAKALRARYPIPMPNQNLTPEDIRGLVKYFRWADESATSSGGSGK